MRVAIAANAEHQTVCGRLLAEGFERHGIAVAHFERISLAATSDADVVVAWGWRNGLVARQAGKRVLVMERAYLRDRFHWFSLGWDGLNGQAWFPATKDGGERWRQHFDGLLADPRPAGSGDYIVILGQVPGDAALLGAPVEAFYRKASLIASQRLGGLPVVIRPHPGDRTAGKAHHMGFPVIGGSLDEVLAGAAAVIAWNSNSLTDAALAGLPLLIGDKGAMTWAIGGRFDIFDPAPHVEGPTLLDRGAWSHRIAFAQWLPEEIASGLAWEHVREAFTPAGGLRFGYWRETADSVHSPAERERAAG